MPTQEDTTTSRVGVAEELIKFRPSPNFKNMKKFLKLKAAVTSPVENVAPAPERALIPVKKFEPKEDVKVKPLLTVQPPLPPYPPPPDSPPKLDIVIKKEKIDDDEAQYKDSTIEASIQGPTPTQVKEHTEKPKKPMCKEYIRGNCKRPVCKFAHEIDLKQLPGVFTFCWNYQNDVCNFPNCRYVHADQFEEARFYRTGILPPHARSHQKKAPTPPPLLEESQTQLAEPSSAFCNPPPVHASNDKAPAVTCVPTSNIGSRPLEEDFRAPLPRSTSPLKREWNDIETFTSSPRDLEPDHMAKKCKNCEMMTFREQYNKEKMDNMIQKTTEDFNKKMSLLNKKSAKLAAVLQTLLRPVNPTKLGVNSIIGGEKDKTILEQLHLMINGNTRLSSILHDDNQKNMHGSNISLSSLVKLLRSDQVLADTRDT